MYNSPIASVLHDAGNLAEEKFKQYGNVYDQVGEMMMILFPNGMHATTAKEATMYSVITWILCKLCRYATSPGEEAKLDSLRDALVYAAMAYTVYTNKKENADGN